MINLEAYKIKTRNNESPIGKEGVLFIGACCDSFRFDEISADILKHFDCAVYTLKEGHNSEGLESFRLMVLAVSSALLEEGASEACRMCLDGLSCGIPLLPICCERQGLSASEQEQFNSLFSSRQIYFKYKKAPGELTYDEKLESFLLLTLTDKEAERRIEEAFDAVLFLSYRKHDRGELQKLISLIQNSNECRLLGIWYDEFLTPHDSFDIIIEERMKRCGWFVLAVTSSLLEENNYVMKIEYPYARENKDGSIKGIIPIELSQTDKDMLNEKFENLPKLHTVQNERELLSFLRDNLPEKKEKGEGKREYLLGLAYSRGILASRNLENAEYFFKESSKKGFQEAELALIELYKNQINLPEYDGERIRKYREKLEERRELIKKLYPIDFAQPSRECFEMAVRINHAAALAFASSCRYEWTSELIERLDCPKQSEYYDICLLERSVLCLELVDICKNSKRADVIEVWLLSADDAYRKYICIKEEQANAVSSEDELCGIRLESAWCEFFERLGSLSKKHTHALKRLELAKDIYQGNDGKNKIDLLFESAMAVLESSLAVEQLDTAKNAGEICESLLALNPNLEEYRTALLYYRLAKLKRAENDLQGAADCYIKCVMLYSTLRQKLSQSEKYALAWNLGDFEAFLDNVCSFFEERLPEHPKYAWCKIMHLQVLFERAEYENSEYPYPEREALTAFFKNANSLYAFASEKNISLDGEFFVLYERAVQLMFDGAYLHCCPSLLLKELALSQRLCYKQKELVRLFYLARERCYLPMIKRLVLSSRIKAKLEEYQRQADDIGHCKALTMLYSHFVLSLPYGKGSAYIEPCKREIKKLSLSADKRELMCAANCALVLRRAGLYSDEYYDSLADLLQERLDSEFSLHIERDFFD